MGYADKKILIIDDQPFIRTVVKRLLEKMGFAHFAEAEDGASGLSLLDEVKPDLVICDIEMQPIDGIVFLQHIKRDKHIDLNQMPVIFLTHHAEARIVQQARDLGIKSFVLKPPTQESLRQHIDLAFFGR
ncbi:MAG: response regulator [Alphaproteobacteria bacterium]|nr:MAG: response regulator [Alphaproteobacteria bacterium]